MVVFTNKQRVRARIDDALTTNNGSFLFVIAFNLTLCGQANAIAPNTENRSVIKIPYQNVHNNPLTGDTCVFRTNVTTHSVSS